MIDLAAWGGVIAAPRPCLKGFFVYSARPLTLNLLAGRRSWPAMPAQRRGLSPDPIPGKPKRDETILKGTGTLTYYENVFIARQDISQPQAEALGEAFAKVVADLGGKVTKREYWGLRNLAFRIKKNRKGHYLLLNIDGPAAAVHEMERQMRINEDVVRYLTVRVDELEEGPSAMMRARDQRDERPERGERFGGRFGGERERGDRDRPRRPRGDEGGAGKDAGVGNGGDL